MGARKVLEKQVQELCTKVGSFYRQRENFRLTREVKETFTKRLRSERRKFFGWKVEGIVNEGGLKAGFRWWFTGVRSAAGNRNLFRSCEFTELTNLSGDAK